MPLTHYEVLGVTPAATYEEIKRGYRRQAMKWHPDRNPGNEKAHRRFIAIKAAYEVLTDGERRATYDAILRDRAASRTYSVPPRRESYRSQPYAPPPYQRTYERRTNSRSWSGLGATLMVMILFNLMRNCNSTPTYKDERLQIVLSDLEKARLNNIIQNDSVLKAVLNHDTAQLRAQGFEIIDSESFRKP